MDASSEYLGTKIRPGDRFAHVIFFAGFQITLSLGVQGVRGVLKLVGWLVGCLGVVCVCLGVRCVGEVWGIE